MKFQINQLLLSQVNNKLNTKIGIIVLVYAPFSILPQDKLRNVLEKKEVHDKTLLKIARKLLNQLNQDNSFLFQRCDLNFIQLLLVKYFLLYYFLILLFPQKKKKELIVGLYIACNFLSYFLVANLSTYEQLHAFLIIQEFLQSRKLTMETSNPFY